MNGHLNLSKYSRKSNKSIFYFLEVKVHSYTTERGKSTPEQATLERQFRLQSGFFIYSPDAYSFTIQTNTPTSELKAFSQ